MERLKVFATCLPFVLALLSTLHFITCQDSCQAKITQDPSPYIIGSGGTLKLTCDVINCNTNSDGQYFWSYVTPSGDLVDCQEKKAVNNCTIQPTVEDAEKEAVICTVVFPENLPPMKPNYTPNILYPPQTAPKIQLGANAREPLVDGDNITCSVSGGKPMDNTTVNFTCTNPDLSDQSDARVGDVVTSVITVDTSKSMATNMTCTCNATWRPEPTLYNQTVSKSFTLAYPPQDPPKIQLADPNKPLKDGTNITCSVSRGNPMYNTSMTFSCTNADLIDQSDVVVDDVVTRVITVNTSRSTGEKITCTCSATWGRQPALYKNTSSRSFGLHDAELDSSSFIIAGVSIGIVSIIAIIAISVVLYRRKRQQPHAGRRAQTPRPSGPRAGDYCDDWGKTSFIAGLPSSMASPAAVQIQNDSAVLFDVQEPGYAACGQ